jgi:dolichol kinase
MRKVLLNFTFDRTQSDAVLKPTRTTNHVAVVTAIISHCLMPRGKFLKIMLYNILAMCIALSFSCIALYCCVKAAERHGRLHAPHHANNGYNSDANVVAAIWLIFTMW